MLLLGFARSSHSRLAQANKRRSICALIGTRLQRDARCSRRGCCWFWRAVSGGVPRAANLTPNRVIRKDVRDEEKDGDDVLRLRCGLDSSQARLPARLVLPSFGDEPRLERSPLSSSWPCLMLLTNYTHIMMLTAIVFIYSTQ